MASGSVPPRRATIYDVAAAAGVSKSLVSLVLQGSPRVSPERRAAVERAMSELRYRPSRAATALAGSRTRTIGVVLDDYRNLWFVDLLDGMRAALQPHGLSLTVADSVHDPRGGRSVVDNFLALRVDAIVIACEPVAEMATPLEVPVVVAGTRAIAIPGSSVVANDDAVGGRLATEHLLGLGHTRIGHLGGAGGAAAARAAAYEAALARAGVGPHTARGAGRTTESDGYAAARALLEERTGITALFAANDTMALGAAAAARDLGRRIPEDLSLIGYDNSPLAASNILRLTTVDDRSLDVGRIVASTLLARLGGAPAAEPVLVEPAVVLRASTAPPPA